MVSNYYNNLIIRCFIIVLKKILIFDERKKSHITSCVAAMSFVCKFVTTGK